MQMKQLISCLLLLHVAALPISVRADTYVIPFSEIRQAIQDSHESPDTVIHDYLAGKIRDELDALGLNIDGGLVFGEVPVEEITEIIRTDCDFPRPYEIHTDATTATVTIDDTSSLTIGLNSIRSIEVAANLTGTIVTDTTAWVRWGQDIIFVGDCVRINTDHGWLGLSLPFEFNLDLMLDLNPHYDDDLVAIVVDKYATLAGEAVFNGGNLQHDFGSISLTDLVISIFKDELIAELGTKGEQAVSDAINTLNYRLAGLDANGVPDSTITAFNGPTTFVLDVSEDDKEFIKELLQEFGIPDIVLAMIEDRGVEVLLQLAILEGAERDAYLASLSAAVSCEALLGSHQTSLDIIPIYTSNGQNCEVADVSGQDTGSYFADMACTDEIAFSPTDAFDFCLAQIGDQAKTLLGNAAAWVADTNQPNDPLPGVRSRPWTTVPTTQLDLSVVSLQGNHQPYMKQFNYKTIMNVPRGSGSCQLEMRVYKSDISEQGLRPLIAIHGGTWQHRGLSFWGLEAGISQLTERGFIVFAPFYRLVGESDGNSECNGASWREVTEDAESALDWVKEYGPELGATTERITVYGQSAGAHLAAWLAAHRPDDVRKALLFYAPVDALEFLAGAVPLGGPYESYRGFGLTALARFFGAQSGTAELHLGQIDFAGLTPTLLSASWQSLIPGTVFDLTLIDPLVPPAYVARCGSATGTELTLINLSMPPAALIDCMKEHLSEFLVENSFNHLLSAEAVPVFLVHGSGDSIVPYEQALDLCGSIDGRVLPIDVIDPLTSYACGAASQTQIVKDAEHALELGVCIEPLCPAGEIGSPTRDAVIAAIEASYLWMMQDPPPPNPDPPVNTINVTRALWNSPLDKVVVWATSNLGDQAGLQMTVHLQGGGTVTKPMSWKASENRWQKYALNFTQKYGSPTSVTVSGAEGSASTQVMYR
jgi:acetyl esterase/lipase